MKFEAMNGNLLPLTVKTKPGINTTGIGDGGDNGDAHTEMKLLAEDLDFSANNINDGSQVLAENKVEEKCLEQDESNKATTIDDEEIEEAAATAVAADALDKDETCEGSKKKATRKKRSTNWEEAERSLLLEVIKPKADFVENRSIDAKNIKAKHLAWLHITKQFNSLNFRHRSLDQIKVQWRSLKNLAKREYQSKPEKGVCVEGANLVEFLEELLKETNILRPHNKAAVGGIIKKEHNDIDDEDTPLAALPAVTHSSDENTTQTSNTTMALPSPPLSAADSQHEIVKESVTSTRKRKKPVTQTKPKQKQPEDVELTKTPTTTLAETLNGAPKPKRQRAQNIKKEAAVVDSTSNSRKLNEIQSTSIEQSALALALSAGTEKSTTLHSPSDANITHSSLNSLNDLAKTNLGNAQNNSNNNNMNVNNNIAISADVKYKKQLFELLKHARLTEMDYLRRDYEQKLRFAQMEQELRMNFNRQMEELKMRLMREEHDVRMRQYQAEHEARMRIYATKGTITGHANNVKANENLI